MLTSKIKQALKAKAHSLKPVVLLGNQGLTEAVKKEIDRALTDHELIKVRMQIQDRDVRRNLFNEICQSLNAHLIQVIGNIGVIYRKNL